MSSQALLTVLLAASLAAALPPALPARGWSYGVTGGLDQLSEQLLPPMRWDIGFLRPMAGFAARTGQVRHEAQVAFLFGFGANRFGHMALELGLRAEYRLSLARGFVVLRGTLVPGVQLFYRNRPAYLFSWDDSHLYWVNGTGIGPAAQWRGRVAGKLDAVADLTVVLFALAARPGAERIEKIEPLDRLGFYFIDTWRGMEPCLPGRYLAGEASVGLEWRAGRSMMAAGYALDLLRISWPAPAVSFAQGLWLRWSPGAAR